MNYKTVESKTELEAIADQLQQEKIIAVDLEADSMYHFKEKVCLIQITTGQNTYLIDPLVIEDLRSLQPIFSASDIQKVFHGSDYDVRSLYRDFQIEINNLFDTQIAARFLGIQETGLEALVQKHFLIALNKRYQKKDWSQRPLPQEMIEYAAKDVEYLIPLAETLTAALKNKKRLSWVLEECELLSQVRMNAHDACPLYLKFKGSGQLRPRSLCILEELLQLRKAIGERKDKPVFKIFGNDVLIQMVRNKPTTPEKLKQTCALSNKQFNMYGEEIVEAVKHAIDIPEIDLPVYPRRTMPSVPPMIPERVKTLKRWRDNRANNLEIDPGLICNKSLMGVIAAQNPLSMVELKTIKELKQWQLKTFGKEIVEVLKEMWKPPVKKNRKGKKKKI